jgi:hypothetical protein
MNGSEKHFSFLDRTLIACIHLVLTGKIRLSRKQKKMLIFIIKDKEALTGKSINDKAQQ